MKRKNWIKAALAFSVCLFLLWWALGTGATLAWFTDTTETARNRFVIGELDLGVKYKNDWTPDYVDLEGATEVFYDEALYEPGYTQVVYLEIANNGQVDFDYKLSITVNGYETAPSVLGNDIILPYYLKFGAIYAEDEATLQAMVDERLEARPIAADDMDLYMLNTWSKDSDYTLEAGEDPHYAALIIYMPEEVGNAANYRGDDHPTVQLGISVFAQQAGTME